METKLSRKRLLGHRGQILAWLIVTFVALSLPLAPRAFAQDQDGVKNGELRRSPRGKLILDVDSGTITFDTTEKTRWIDWRGQEVSENSLKAKSLGRGDRVWVKWRLGTGGSMEAVEVRLANPRNGQ